MLNSTTIRHLSSLNRHEFENLSSENPTNINRTESKKILNLFFPKRKSKLDANRDSGFVENDSSEEKTPAKIDSSKQKLEPTKPAFQTQIVTDACFVYRKEVIRPSSTCHAMILRGREIAYEAAHSPSIPSLMPYYTHDQIRELYGTLGKKTHCLQNEYVVINDEWKGTCPLPKFRLEPDEETIAMAAYISTGLSNPRDVIRGSFRTSIAEQRSMTPSPLLVNLRMDFSDVCQTKIDEIVDLDQETTAPTEIGEEFFVEDSIDNLIQIVRDVHQYVYTYDEDDESITTNKQSENDSLTPIIETNVDCSTLSVRRQSNHIGHYGFELEQTFDGKIVVSSIINDDYCRDLCVGDEIIEIHHQRNFQTLEQCHLLFHSLWHKQHETVQMLVKKCQLSSRKKDFSFEYK